MKNGIYSSFTKFLSGNILLTGLNLLRDISIATAFGTTISVDHFFLAATLLIFTVTVAGNACRSIYVPVLQRSLSGNSHFLFNKIASQMVNLNVKTIAVFAIALFLLATLTAELAKAGGKSVILKTAEMLIYILPMYALSAFVEVSQGILQTRNHILLPGLMRIGLPLGIVFGATCGHQSLGISALAIGGLVGSALASSGILYLLYKENLLAWRPPNMPPAISSEVRAGMTALTISSCIAYINPVIDLWMAGAVGPGAVSSLGYASRITVGVASLLVGSLAPVFLHQFSRYAAVDNHIAIRNIYTNFLSIAPWFGILFTVGIWLLSGVIAPLLYQHGHFSAADTKSVVSVIDAYALQFPFYLVCTVGFTLISALAKNHIFIRLNIILLIANIAADWTLMRLFGLTGIALSTSIVYAISMISLNTYLLRDGIISFSLTTISSGIFALTGLLLAFIAMTYFDMKITLTDAPYKYVQGGFLLLLLAAVGLICNRDIILKLQAERLTAT